MYRNFVQQAHRTALLLGVAGLSLVLFATVVLAEANPHLNYQGKLTDTTGLAVPNATYQMSFSLYTEPTGGTPIWTEVRTGANEVTVQNGLFSIMLGEVTPLTSVNFAQTLYLGVTIDPDGEMVPRKILGTVPAAFEAFNTRTFDNLATTSFVRSDEEGTLEATTSNTLFSFIQNGTGAIARLFAGATEVFTVTHSGNVGIGTSTPSRLLSIAGDAVITGALHDSGNSAGTNGMILQTTGAGTTWVATSSLGFPSGHDAVSIAGLDYLSISNQQITAGAIGPTHLAAANFGVFECTGTYCVFTDGPYLTTSDLDTVSLFDFGDMPNMPAASLLYASAINTPAALAAGTNGDILRMVGGMPDWAAPSSLGFGDGTFLGLTDTPSSFTANRIPFTNSGGNALTDSANFTYDGTNLNLGGANGIAFGGTRFITASTTNDSITFGENAGATFTNLTTYNVAIGFEAGRYASTSAVDYNNFMGYQAGMNNTGTANNIFGPFSGLNNIGSGNNLFGFYAGRHNTGDSNNLFGYWAGDHNTGFGNNILGNSAGQYNTGGSSNIFGYHTGRHNTGSYNNLFGNSAGLNNTGSYSEFIGFETGARMSASSTVAIGGLALRGGGGNPWDGNAATTTNNTVIGYRAGYNAQTGADNNILLGYQAADNLTTGANNIVIGYDVDLQSATQSNTLNIGNLLFGTGIDGTGTTLSSGNVGIGTSTPYAQFTIQDNLIGESPGSYLFAIESSYGSFTASRQSIEGPVYTVYGFGTHTPDAFVSIVGPDAPAGSLSSAPTAFSVVGGTGDPFSFVQSGDGGGVVMTGGDGGEDLGSGAGAGGDIVLNPGAGGAGGGLDGNIILSNLRGNIGIGTSTPSSKLTIAGDLFATGAFRDSANSAGTLGMVLQTTGAGTTWVATSSLGFSSQTLTLGTDNQIPFMNSAGTDFEYASNFTYDGTDLGLAGTTGLMLGGDVRLSRGAANRLDLATGDSLNIVNGGLMMAGIRYFYADPTSDSIRIGENAGATFTNQTTYNVAIGFEAGRYASTSAVDYNNFIGYRAGLNNTGYSNNIFGSHAGYNNTGVYNNIFGESAGVNNTGFGNSLLGGYSGQNNTGDENNLFGSFAGGNNTGSHNNLFGHSVGYENTGSYNEMIGYETGRNLQATSTVAIGGQVLRGGAGSTPFQAVNNVALGYRAGYNAQTGANNNILLGYQAADNLTTGANNIVIGYDVDMQSATQSNTLNIGNLLFGTGINGTGTTLSSGNIGIGTSSPSSKLTVVGDSYITGAFRDSTNSAGTLGMVLQTTGAGTEWVATSTLGIGGGASSFLELSDTPASFTANRVPYMTAGTLTTNANFEFNGNRLTIGGSVAGLDGSRLTVREGNPTVGMPGDKVAQFIRRTTGTSGSANDRTLSAFLQIDPSGNVEAGRDHFAMSGNSLVLNNVTRDFNNNIYGSSGVVTFMGSGRANHLAGSLGTVGIDNAAAAINSIAGAENSVQFFNGSATSSYGTFAEVHVADATSLLAAGMRGSVRISGTGQIGKAIGFYAPSIQDGSGNIDTTYGLLIDEQTAGTLANYGLYVDGANTENFIAGNVGIGTSSPNAKLTVHGDINISDGSSGLAINGVRMFAASTTLANIMIGENAGETFNSSTPNNVVIGFEAGRYASTTNSDNNFIGYQAGLNSIGVGNNIFGSEAGLNNIGSGNNIFGSFAGQNNTSDGNNLFGMAAGQSNTGVSNNILGYFAGLNNSGNFNNIIGQTAGTNNTGSYSEFIGFETGALMSASSTVAIGGLALRGGSGFAMFSTNAATTTNNTVVGYGAGYNVLTGGDNNILLGYQAADNLTTGANNIVIGYDVDLQSATQSNTLNVGNLLFGTGIDGTGTTLSSGNIGIGTSAPSSKLTVAGNVHVGTTSGTPLVINQGNQTNVHSLTIENMGAGGTGIRISRGSGGNGMASLFHNSGSRLRSTYTNFGGYAQGVLGNGLGIPDEAAFRFTTDANAASSFGGVMSVQAGGRQDLFTGLQSNDAVVFNVDYDGGAYLAGSVGIGTTTPTAQLTTTGTVRLANFGAGALETDALGNVTVGSDERQKNILDNYRAGLEEVLTLSPILFNWASSSGFDTETVYAGFSAQNVQAALPDAVGESPNGFLTLSDRPILAAVINAIKELYAIVTGNQDKIIDLEKRIEALEAERGALPPTSSLPPEPEPEPELEPEPVSEPDASTTTPPVETPETPEPTEADELADSDEAVPPLDPDPVVDDETADETDVSAGD